MDPEWPSTTALHFLLAGTIKNGKTSHPGKGRFARRRPRYPNISAPGSREYSAPVDQYVFAMRTKWPFEHFQTILTL